VNPKKHTHQWTSQVVGHTSLRPLAPAVTHSLASSLILASKVCTEGFAPVLPDHPGGQQGDGGKSLAHRLPQASVRIDPPVGEASLAARWLAWQSKLGHDLMPNLPGEHGEVVHRGHEHALGMALQSPACQAAAV
jgi:hypothetical protein